MYTVNRKSDNEITNHGACGDNVSVLTATSERHIALHKDMTHAYTLGRQD